ncbi:variable large family protein, partial [Borrelia crocidurae]
DVLGFKVNKDTKRSDVAGYFDSLGGKLGEASEELEKVASKAMVGIDKSDESKNPIRNAVDTAKGVLSSLKTHLESLGTVGDSKPVGDSVSNANGVSASTDELQKVYNALKGIMGIVIKEGKVKEPSASSVTLASNSIGVANMKDGAKVLATDVAGGAVGDKAATIVSSVRGEEILAAILRSSEGDSAGTIGANATANTSAVSFARGGTAANLAQDEALAGAVSGGIALRSLVKDGKLAAHSGNDNKAVQSAGISAVNKLLVAVEGIIKKTVKNVLEKVKQEVDKARESKAVGQQ